MATSALYHPLDKCQRHIRLLRLHPAQGSEPISCDLFIEDLGSRTSYEALSYVWGTSTAVKSIQLNGQGFPTRIILYSALKRLRQPKEPRLLWIDAICINQSDDTEKGHQVDLMSHIYTSASSVVIWLGDVPTEDEPFTASAFYMLRNRNNHSSGLLQASHFNGVCRCYQFIVTSSWFTQSWTVQEAILARKLVVTYGPGYANFDDIVRYDGSSIGRTMMDAGLEFSIGRYRAIADMRKQRGYLVGNSITFLEAIYRHWDRQATDPRDKIYAFLGIVNDWQGYEKISSDYSLDANAVFTMATYEIMRRQRSMDFLPSAVLGFDKLGGPSWVPHFTSATLRRATQRVNTLYRTSLSLCDMDMFSLYGRHYGSLKSVVLERRLENQPLKEAIKISRAALEAATGMSGLSDFILIASQYVEPSFIMGKMPQTSLDDLRLWRPFLLRFSGISSLRYSVMDYDTESLSNCTDDEIVNKLVTFIHRKSKGATQNSGSVISVGIKSIMKLWRCWRANEEATATQLKHLDAFKIHRLGRHLLASNRSSPSPPMMVT